MDALYRYLNVHNLSLSGVPLLDPLTNTISPKWLPPPPPVQKVLPSPNKMVYGKYGRKDIHVGQIHLDVSENGLLIQLSKDSKIFSEISNGKVTVGGRHQIDKGIYYILSDHENAILEVDTSIHNDWEVNTTVGVKCRKYILVKKIG